MYFEHVMPLSSGKIRWKCEYADNLRCCVEDANGKLLAMENEYGGFHVMIDGHTERIDPSLDPLVGDFRATADQVAWRRELPDYVVTAEFNRMTEEEVSFLFRLTAKKVLVKPQLSWGIGMILEPYFDRSNLLHGPSQCGYTFLLPEPLTLFLISDRAASRSDGKFPGCQALVTENPDPRVLEFHQRTPPGYVAKTTGEYVLEPDESIVISGVIALHKGYFYEKIERIESLQDGIDVLPERYSYFHFCELAVPMFLDQNKYSPEHQGILYHTAVDGEIGNLRFQTWTEGPGWGGAFDCENSWNCLLAARHFPQMQDQLVDHTRKMLRGWIGNPRFAVPEGVYYQQEHDMDDALIVTGWFPDCIWTTAQAELLRNLCYIYQEISDPLALEQAEKLAKFLLSHTQKDGTIPTIWQFPIEYSTDLDWGWRPHFSRCTRKDKRAEILAGPQPVAALRTARALLMFHKIKPQAELQQAAETLKNWAVKELAKPGVHTGNGEFDYLVFRTGSMDPTGLGYVLEAMQEFYNETGEEILKELIIKYMDILCSYSSNLEVDECRMRPVTKRTEPPYNTDIGFAGGIAHGNWQPVYRRGFGQRFNLLMNRNEIADGMFAAWKVSQLERHKQHLLAYLNWMLGFQFTSEDPDSPVTTCGSAPQNQFWTNDTGNWNNDYALTAFKWVGTYLRIIETGFAK